MPSMYYYINNILVINSQLLHNCYNFKSINFFINQKKFSTVFNLHSYRNFPCVFTVFTSCFCFITKHVKLIVNCERLFVIQNRTCFSSKKKKHIFIIKSKQLVESLRNTAIALFDKFTQILNTYITTACSNLWHNEMKNGSYQHHII